MKKIICCLLSLLLFIPGIVFGEMLNVDDLVENFNHSELAEYYEENNFTLESVNNMENSTIDIYINDTLAFEIPYNETCFYVIHDQKEITQEDLEYDFSESVMTAYLFYGVLEIVGNNPYTILEGTNITEIDYDTYGLLLESEYISTEDFSGDFTRKFIVSLDTEKITNLINDYCVVIDLDVKKDQKPLIITSCIILGLAFLYLLIKLFTRKDKNVDNK